ncbi:hypothetical protein GCM10027286_34390 [Virgibacillus ainsalahensis]
MGKRNLHTYTIPIPFQPHRTVLKVHLFTSYIISKFTAPVNTFSQYMLILLEKGQVQQLQIPSTHLFLDV